MRAAVVHREEAAVVANHEHRRGTDGDHLVARGFDFLDRSGAHPLVVHAAIVALFRFLNTARCAHGMSSIGLCRGVGSSRTVLFEKRNGRNPVRFREE